MARKTKLNDIQHVLLTTAVKRDDGSLMPLPAALGDQGIRIRRSVAGLITRMLAQEVAVEDDRWVWRTEEGRRLGVTITDAGRFIIAAVEPQEVNAQPEVEAPAPTPPETAIALPPVVELAKPSSKITHVVELLKREEGATLTELVDATGWLPHTTRAALTGLRKKGHALDKNKRGDATCYRIAEAA